MQFLSLKLFPLFVSHSFLTCIVGEIINPQKNTSFPALIFFGDSIVDTGNNNYITTITKANHPPYGQDFMGGRPTGRFSNGKVPSDLLAEGLGIKPLLPPYLDPSLKPQDLLTGVNFAFGGAGYDPLTSNLTRALSLWDELELFKGYINNLKKIAGDERTSTILSESLIMAVAGSNDIVNNYFAIPIRRNRYDINAYINLLVRYASDFVQDLYRLGARRFGVSGVPPLGCVPSQRTLKGGITRKCVDQYNHIAQMYNNKLSHELSSLNTRYPDALMIYIDIYDSVLDIIDNPLKYGFGIANKGCCGTGTMEVIFLCRRACSNVSEYVFWDSFHPTEKTYRIMVNQVLKQLLDRFNVNENSLDIFDNEFRIQDV